MSPAVIVSGSAGGIGQAICRRFRGVGYFVVGLDRLENPEVDEWIAIDLSDSETVRDVAAGVCKRYPVSVVVHNAATQPLAAAGETPVDAFLETMRVNVIAADSLVAGSRNSLAELHGAVVVVSSVHAHATTRNINAYATSKAALEGWVRSAAIDLAPAVRVNAVRPGAIDTAKLHEGFARWGDDADARWRMLEARTPLGRVGEATEVAAAVHFLASSDAAFITGSTLVVDGGAAALLGTE